MSKESFGIPPHFYRDPVTTEAIEAAKTLPRIVPDDPAEIALADPAPPLVPLGHLMTRTEIESANDGLLRALASLAVGEPLELDGNGAFRLMRAAGAHGWTITLVERGGLKIESIAALAFAPGWQAVVTVRHARPEIAVFRAFLLAYHGAVRGRLIA